MKKILSIIALAALTIGLLGSCKKEELKVSVTDVTLDKTELTLVVGDADVKLTATVVPEKATDKSVSWSSDMTDVATVDQEGNVHAVAEGKATITVTTKNGGKTATCTVTVKATGVPVSGVTLDKTEMTITVGDPDVKLTATVAPENATDKSVSWSSDRTDVATVDQEGKVHAVAPGRATITVSTVNGDKTATCAVAVAVPVQYVEIIAKYDGQTETPLKWSKQNLAISESGKKAWKGGSSSAVKVPGTNDNVIVGDYFQWAAYPGYCGNASDADKGLLLYTAFTHNGCGDASDAFTFKGGKQFSLENAPYYSNSAYTKYTGTDSKTTLESSDDVANIILGGNWHTPTSDEFTAMRQATYWAWDETDKGYYVYTPNPASDAGKYNDGGTGTYDKSDALLFFPAAGDVDNSELSNAGGYGFYWSGTLSSSDAAQANSLRFYKTYFSTSVSLVRFLGFSVRPVSE